MIGSLAMLDWLIVGGGVHGTLISRALVAIFAHPLLASSLAFRGGTALYKLHIKPPARYSEDIDLVQIKLIERLTGNTWAGREIAT